MTSDPGSTIPQPAGLGGGTPRPDGKGSHAFGSGASGSGWSAANLSVPPEDLSGERMLRDAARMSFEERQVPSLGGIMLLAKLGQGGMGAVYYGMHPRLRTEVAVKVLPFQLADRSPELVNRFIREGQIAAQIKSPHLVGVTDVNEENGLFYNSSAGPRRARTSRNSRAAAARAFPKQTLSTFASRRLRASRPRT